jgi:type II secretory pathway pseudopilin PulG
LIEMILVMALLVVAVSMVSPRLSGFIRGRALESEARRVLALTHAARSRAISESLPVLLWLDSATGHYGIERETPGQNGDPLSQEFAVDENLKVTFDQAQRLIGQTLTGTRTTRILPGVSSSQRPATARTEPSIRLLPDGTIDEDSPNAIRIEDSDGSVLWLVEGSDRRHYEIRTGLQ